jgi:diaminopimelate decarboxylase
MLAENTEYRKKNPDKTRAWHLKTKYGITPEQWDDLFKAQGEKCKICLSPDHGGSNWHTDHCHDTGRVRGILCHGCNAGLGHFKDNKAALARAIDYLGNA